MIPYAAKLRNNPFARGRDACLCLFVLEMLIFKSMGLGSRVSQEVE